jgi:hypothetical protein
MKTFRLMLVIVVAFTIATVVANCDKEEPEDIDPCPGWPAFKVGNEWEYEHSCTSWSQDTIQLIADTIIYQYGHYYLGITQPPWPGYEFYRCVGDKVYNIGAISVKDSIYQHTEITEYVLWDFSKKEGEGWWIIQKSLESDVIDTSGYAWISKKDGEIKDTKGNTYKATCIRYGDRPPEEGSQPSSSNWINIETGLIHSGSKTGQCYRRLISFNNMGRSK